MNEVMDPGVLFAQVAQEYCDFMRSPNSAALHDWLKRVASLLSRLCAGALALPVLDASEEDLLEIENEALAVPEFGPLDSHRLVFDPYKGDQPPIVGSLTDDLIDIDRDLREGLALSVVALPDAIWFWRFTFMNHWGQHAISALYAIYHAVRSLENE